MGTFKLSFNKNHNCEVLYVFNQEGQTIKRILSRNAILNRRKMITGYNYIDLKQVMKELEQKGYTREYSELELIVKEFATQQIISACTSFMRE